MDRRILTIPAFCHPKRDLLSKIGSSRSFITVHSINAEILVMANEDKALGDILMHNDHNICDGYWVARALGYKYGAGVEKISGSDLVFDLLDLATSLNWKVFLLGASEDVLRKAKKKLTGQYENLKLESYSPPYCNASFFPEEENLKMLQRIERFKPQVLIVCFGPPKQEYWVHKNQKKLEELGVKASLSAGGTLDFIAGKVTRAPEFVQNIGMEWLYRLYKEPGTRFKRQFKRLPKYFVFASIDVVRYRLRLKR